MSAHIRAVILAAGKGTRMRSARAKVLHELCGKPLLWYALRALRDAGVADVTVVTNGEVEPHVATIAADAGRDVSRTIIQEQQFGTGHAVSLALGELMPRDGGRVLVLYGDMPLLESALLREMIAGDGGLTLLTARMPLPSNFGRVVREGERVTRIVEARDATPEQLALDEMNAGLYAFDEAKLRRAVTELRADNAQGEYYLTDTVAALVEKGERIDPIVADDYRSVLGINDRAELAAAAAELRRRLCERHLHAGVTIVDPVTTYLEPDLDIGADVTIFPNTALRRSSRIGAHSEIGPNARLENASIGEHTVVTDSVIIDSAIGDFSLVGPWAHIRSGCIVGTGSRVGNFVELKAAELAAGVKVGHLAYLGDAAVGERANVGAGAITCNYDGVRKQRTIIGKDAFIGSNSSLVAPVDIGDGASTGAGTVVIRDVTQGERVVGNPARVLPRKN